MAKRRTKGDGGLTQRHDHATCPPVDPATGERPEHRCRGRWQGTLDVEINGRVQRKYVYGRTQAIAKAKLDEARNDRKNGTLVVASPTVSTWLDHWLDHIAVHKLRPQTLRGYRSKVDRYIKPTIGRHRLSALRPEHVRALHAAMRSGEVSEDGEPLSEASVRQTHAILRKALDVALKERKVGVNVCALTDAPSTETAKRQALTTAQADAVLATTDDPRWWLALVCALRQGEVLGLRWCDVDTDCSRVRVVQSLQRGSDGGLIFGPPKSRASVRAVPLEPRVQARLKVWWHESGCPDLGEHGSTALVFPGHAGRPRQPRADYEAWRTLLAAAGQPVVSLHAARQTALSMLEEAGASDRLAAQIAGHSQVRVTHGYQSAEEARIRAAFESVAKMLGAGSGDDPDAGQVDRPE